MNSHDDDDYAHDNWKDQQLDKKWEEERMPDITMDVRVNTDQLLIALRQLDFDTLAKFIIQLDDDIAEYGFSIQLLEHFKKHEKECTAEDDGMQLQD